MAPMPVLGSRWSPGCSFLPTAKTFSRTWSLMDSSTIRREPALQTSPWLKKMPQVAAVRHDDVRGLAAAFQRDPLHVALPGVAQEELADLGRAGEGNAVDVHMP